MIKIFTGIAAGKTYRMIQSFRSHPDNILLVFCDQERQRICKQYEMNKSEADRIFTFSELEKLRGRNGKVLVDNADMFIRYMIPGKDVYAISMTYGDDEWTKKN